MMHEIFRVLKPGGRFITFSLHTASSILKYFEDFNVQNMQNVLYSSMRSLTETYKDDINGVKADRKLKLCTTASASVASYAGADAVRTHITSVNCDELGWRISTYNVKSSRWRDTDEDRAKSVAHTMVVCDKVSSPLVSALVDGLYISRMSSKMGETAPTPTLLPAVNCIGLTESSVATSLTTAATQTSEGDGRNDHGTSSKACSFQPFPLLPPDNRPIKGTLDKESYDALSQVARVANLKASLRSKHMTVQAMMHCLSRAVDLCEYAAEKGTHAEAVCQYLANN